MAKETPTRSKRSDAKLVKVEPVKQAQVTVVGAPELIVTKASDKGVACVVRNVRLTWVFVKNYREDSDNPLKGIKSVTLLIPKKGSAAFLNQLGPAVRQTLQLNKKIVDMEEKKAALAIALAIGVKVSLLKDGDEPNDKGVTRPELAGYYTWQVKKNAYRDSKNDAFVEEYPLTFRDALGNPVAEPFRDREFYSGVYADVALTLATFDNKGSKGVTAYLNGLRKNRDGERIGGFDPFAGVAPAASESGAVADVDFL